MRQHDSSWRREHADPAGFLTEDAWRDIDRLAVIHWPPGPKDALATHFQNGILSTCPRLFPLSSTSPPCWSHPGASPFPPSMDFEVSPVRAEPLAPQRSLVHRPAPLVLRSPPPWLPPLVMLPFCTTVLLLPCFSTPPFPLPFSTSSPSYEAHIIILNRVALHLLY